MAERDDARSEFNPKYRIVGAIILVSLVVIFVPLVLNEREPPAELISIGESPPRGAITETRVVVSPVTGVASKTKVETETTPIPTTPPPVADAASKHEIKPLTPVPEPQTASTPEKSTKDSTPPDKITKGWVVQVGTFTNTENAIRLRDKLKNHGHTVQTETVTLAGGKALRLRVGPFHDKDQAAKILAQIRKETGVKGVIKSYP